MSAKLKTPRYPLAGAEARVVEGTMRIEVISDPICPWCYIGKRWLERALRARPQESVEIRWRPFRLNPDMPPAGMARATYLAAKFGGAEQAQRLYARIAEAGAEEGIEFRANP